MRTETIQTTKKVFILDSLSINTNLNKLVNYLFNDGSPKIANKVNNVATAMLSISSLVPSRK